MMTRLKRPIRAGEGPSGFTVIEVLVTIGVLGLLASLLVPAIQSVREKGRRTRCMSQLKQLILAYHEYEEVHGHFPGPVENGESWAIHLLPYLEQAKPSVLANGEVRGLPETLGIYACPSDGIATGRPTFHGGMSYFPNHGMGNSQKNGFFYADPYRAIRTADVTDGLSVTAALSERLVSPLPQDAQGKFDEDSYGRRRLIRKTRVFLQDFDSFIEECEFRSTPPGRYLIGTDSYNHIQVPNHLSCTNGDRNEPEAQEFMTVSATSLHSGGVNVAFADGAVRLISESIDLDVWRALGTRNGQEPMEVAPF